MDNKPSFGIIGPGRLGSALAIKLRQAGYPLTGITASTPKNTEKSALRLSSHPFSLHELVRKSQIIFLTVSDDIICAMAEKISSIPIPYGEKYLAHTSGALSSEVLRKAKEAGYITFSFHPLQSFADSEVSFKGCFIAFEGDEEAMLLAEKMAVDLEAHPHRLSPDQKVLYHLGAVIACGGLIALEYEALRILELAGIPRDEGLKALLPILRGTLNNLARLGPELALTGPFARGDIGTVQAHLDALKEEILELIPLYNILGTSSLKLASLNNEEKDKIKKIMDQFNI